MQINCTFPLPRVSTSNTSPCFFQQLHINLPHNFSFSTSPDFKECVHSRRKGWFSQTLLRVSSDNQIVTVASPTKTPSVDVDSASDVVRNFYTGINGRDLPYVESLIAENCVYEDLIFPRPFIGRKAIIGFFEKFIDSISADLQFVIDDVSGEDSSAVGVTWHLEWKGKTFPFSKGCSFYRLEVVNGQRQIIYGRDSVEPFIKPGETALVAIRGVTWLLQRFPRLADQL